MGAANLSEDGVAAEDTAFRAAERVYRRRRDAAGTGRRARQALLRTRPLDLVAVLDFSAPPPAADGAAGTAARGGRGVGDAVLLDGLSFSAYALRSRPGLVVLPRVLSDAEQLELAECCLRELIEPPARTNLTPEHGAVAGLWEAARAGAVRQPRHATAGGAPAFDWVATEQAGACGSDAHGAAATAAQPARALLQSLRWSTCGAQYDWGARRYDWAAPRRELPPWLRALSARLVAALLPHPLVADADGADGGEPFRADAAIVNFYWPADWLGGHADDAERDLRRPIVAFSVGAPGILLVGGADRSCAPDALLLRSGDAVLMAGPARRAVHGMPRVLLADDPIAGAAPAGEQPAARRARAREDAAARVAAAPLEGVFTGDGDRRAELRRLLGRLRINVSVREA